MFILLFDRKETRVCRTGSNELHFRILRYDFLAKIKVDFPYTDKRWSYEELQPTKADILIRVLYFF